MDKLPAAVIFDMDGLLFNSEALYRDAILAAARELGHQFTVADFLKMVGRSSAVNRLALQEHIGPAHDVAEFHAAWMQHIDGMKASLSLKAGVVEILNRLDELQLPRAICTSSSREDVRHNLSLHALAGRFKVVVAAGDYARPKPEPDPFLHAADVLGVTPAECWALKILRMGFVPPPLRECAQL